MTSESQNRESFRIQAGYCTALDAPITARISIALAGALDRNSDTGRRVLDWPGEPVADALALRLIGGLHALSASDRELDRIFAGEVSDAGEMRGVLQAALRGHDAALLPWLDGPPQTNEPMRSGAMMTGLLHLTQRYGPRIEVLEIGSSAGLNLLVDRYRYELGGITIGPDCSPVTIAPEWRGVAPPAAPIEIVSARGVDVAPVDLVDPAAAARLEAYVWVDAPARQARLRRAIAMVRDGGVMLDLGDAADWLDARLAEPQAAGVTRVLMHSIVWQYLGDERRARIAAAMEAAGARATRERPLGWVMMEFDPVLGRPEVRVRGWPGDQSMEVVALAHAHGAWVEGLEPPYETADYVMRTAR